MHSGEFQTDSDTLLSIHILQPKCQGEIVETYRLSQSVKHKSYEV